MPVLVIHSFDRSSAARSAPFDGLRDNAERT
jgi:hypothetical protein